MLHSCCLLSFFFLDWGGWVDDSALPFILIIGTFRPEQVVEILDGFLNSVSLLLSMLSLFVYNRECFYSSL
jgi:hypothetical protein